MAANIFSKEGMRRFKQGFLESIGVANSSRELDTEFEQYVSRFTSAGTNVGNLHDRLKSYIRSQEELSNASAGVFSTLSSVFSALPSGLRDVRSVSSRSSVGGAGAGAGIGGGGDDGIAGSSLMGSGTTGMRGSSATTNESLTAQLQMCAAAHELQSETVFNPSKKYFQRELLRPLELLSKKVSKISAVVTKCRGLYVDVDAFQHKVGVAQKKGNAPKVRQFSERLASFTTELASTKKHFFLLTRSFEAEARLVVEHVLGAFVAFQLHVALHTGDTLQPVAEGLPDAGAHMVELGCRTGRARSASVLVPEAFKPTPSAKLREFLQVVLSTRPRALAPPLHGRFSAELPFSTDTPFDHAHASVRPPSLPAGSSADRTSSTLHRQPTIPRAQSAPSSGGGGGVGGGSGGSSSTSTSTSTTTSSSSTSTSTSSTTSSPSTSSTNANSSSGAAATAAGSSVGNGAGGGGRVVAPSGFGVVVKAAPVVDDGASLMAALTAGGGGSAALGNSYPASPGPKHTATTTTTVTTTINNAALAPASAASEAEAEESVKTDAAAEVKKHADVRGLCGGSFLVLLVVFVGLALATTAGVVVVLVLVTPAGKVRFKWRADQTSRWIEWAFVREWRSFCKPGCHARGSVDRCLSWCRS
jgi:hypothetical protein